MLLKALVDQRMVDNSTSTGGGIRWTTALRDAKVKKKVDTKASKGRKLRYQVQEKIQNFVAPVENNRWHKQQIESVRPFLFTREMGLLMTRVVSSLEACWDRESGLMRRRVKMKTKSKWMA